MSNNCPLPDIVYHATVLMHLESIQESIKIHREEAFVNLDFGKGFYTSTNHEQSKERAIFLQEKFRHPVSKVLPKQYKGIVISFELNRDILYNQDKNSYKQFDYPDEEWAQYIAYNRVSRSESDEHKYLWTYGSLADGKSLLNNCKAYLNEVISGSELITRIAPHKIGYDQLSFHVDENLLMRL